MSLEINFTILTDEITANEIDSLTTFLRTLKSEKARKGA